MPIYFNSARGLQQTMDGGICEFLFEIWEITIRNTIDGLYTNLKNERVNELFVCLRPFFLIQRRFVSYNHIDIHHTMTGIGIRHADLSFIFPVFSVLSQLNRISAIQDAF